MTSREKDPLRQRSISGTSPTSEAGSGATPSSSSLGGTSPLSSSASKTEQSSRWEALATDVALYFGPPSALEHSVGETRSRLLSSEPVLTSAAPALAPSHAPLGTAGGALGGAGRQPAAGADAATRWRFDMYVLMLDVCPASKLRRRLLSTCVCAGLWKACLDEDRPDLARKLAVWIGVLFNNDASRISRRTLLDVPLAPCSDDTMLAHVLDKGIQDDRWLRVARALVHLGARTNASTLHGQPLLLFAMEQAEKGPTGFRELLASLLAQLGKGVDQWEKPTVLLEDSTAECPICLEPLWTSTPTAFVRYAKDDSPHVICGHFFCFDCASAQFVKQQEQRSGEFHCPICRAQAQDLGPLPDIGTNPKLWFQFIDAESQGCIDRNTVAQALEVTLPIDTEKLREAMEASCWSDWDKQHSDHIRECDFFAPGGLLEWVRAHQHALQTAKERGPAPPLLQAEEWFMHWDASKRGLKRADTLRAMCYEARVSSLEVKRVQKLKEAIQRVWDRHASADGTLSRERFLRAGAAEELARAIEGSSGGAEKA